MGLLGGAVLGLLVVAFVLAPAITTRRVKPSD
jgi:hypothetical protein